MYPARGSPKKIGPPEEVLPVGPEEKDVFMKGDEGMDEVY